MRAAFQDGLVNLCFDRGGVISRWVERSEKRRGPRQVALSLCDDRLFDERIQVVRCNIENLVKLSQRFGKTTKLDIGNRAG